MKMITMERDFTSRSHHDMGGLEAGSIQSTEHDYVLWEKRVDALMVLLSSPPLKMITVDQLRKGIESLPPGALRKNDLLRALDFFHHSSVTAQRGSDHRITQ